MSSFRPFTPAFGQQTTLRDRNPPFQIPNSQMLSQGPEVPGDQKLTRFSLDFPGGTPQQLIAAIEKAMAKPVNAIIPMNTPE